MRKNLNVIKNERDEMMIRILVTSDIHGQLDCFVPLIKQMKKLKADLVIDNGDFLDGSPATFYYKHINKQVHPMISLANEIYDVAVFGNHDLNYTISTIQSLRHQFKFPWISCNIDKFAAPYFTKMIQGKKFIVIGATTHFTPLWDEHGYLQELSFQSCVEAIRYWVSYVKAYENPDYLIVSYHGGFSEHPITGAVFQERIGENQGNEILESIPDIDLFITGHQHLFFNEKVHDTLIIQPTSHGKGFMEVQVDFSNGYPVSTGKFHSLDDGNLLYPKEVEDWLNEEITYVDEDYTYKGLLQSRLSSHPFIQLIHDMQLKTTGAEISVYDLNYSEVGGFKNKITIRDLLENASRENKLKVIHLTGIEIKSLIEQSAAVFAINEEGKLDFSTNVYPDTPQRYQYDFWGGISYELDIRESIGNRVKNLTFNGESLMNYKNYRVVMNSYRLTGYDFPLLKNRKVHYESNTIFPFLLKDYLENHFPIQVPNHGNFKIIY